MAQRVQAVSAWELMNSSMTTQELRRAYSKQAYTARQRLGKIRQAYGNEAEVVQRRAGDFQPLSKLGKLTRAQIAAELSGVQKFLASGSSRVREYGQVRQDIIDSFQRSGYEFVNESNLDSLYQFLEDARARHLGSIYGSDQLIETWNRAQKRGMTSEQLLGNIEYWAEKQPKSLRIRADRRSSRADFEKESDKWI